MSTKSFSDPDGTELIDITPDPSLMPKLSFANYSAPQAIAELVDNAIDEPVEGKTLVVSVNIEKTQFTVSDNGMGMNRKKAEKAMVLAHSEKSGKLGEFGLGMKTACLSLGREFEIITSSLGDEKEYILRFDLDDWNTRSRDWKLPIGARNADPANHYTIITIRKLRTFYAYLPELIRDDLRKRYSPFIRSGEVIVKVNKQVCEPREYELTENTKKELDIILKSGKRIFGWYGLLKESSQKGYYGFSTFRRGRMITCYDKIGFEPHPTLARIVGEINMDHVAPTHSKREWIKESKEYREVESAMAEELRELIRSARRKASEDTITPEVKREIDVWKDKIIDSLRSKEFKNYTSRFKNVIKNPQGKELIEVDIEQRDKAEEEVGDTSKTSGKTRGERTPQRKQKARRPAIRILGKRVEFNHFFNHLGTAEPWYIFKYDPDKSLEIFTNIDFPAYYATAVMHIAESISKVLIGLANEDESNVDDLKELILRKASELKTQIL